jgi:hypothetical protein
MFRRLKHVRLHIKLLWVNVQLNFCTRFPRTAIQILEFRAFLRKRAKTPTLQRDDLLSDGLFFILMIVPVTKAYIWRDAYILPPSLSYDFTDV